MQEHTAPAYVCKHANRGYAQPQKAIYTHTCQALSTVQEVPITQPGRLHAKEVQPFSECSGRSKKGSPVLSRPQGADGLIGKTRLIHDERYSWTQFSSVSHQGSKEGTHVVWNKPGRLPGGKLGLPVWAGLRQTGGMRSGNSMCQGPGTSPWDQIQVLETPRARLTVPGYIRSALLDAGSYSSSVLLPRQAVGRDIVTSSCTKSPWRSISTYKGRIKSLGLDTCSYSFLPWENRRLQRFGWLSSSSRGRGVTGG